MLKRSTVCFVITHVPSGTIVVPDLRIQADYDVPPDLSEEDNQMAAVDAAFPKVATELCSRPGGEAIYANRHEHYVDPVMFIDHPLH
jgi:hypothetical protein